MFAVRTGVALTLGIEDEVRATERAIGAFTFLPRRYTRLDGFLIDHPVEQLRIAAGRIADNCNFK